MRIALLAVAGLALIGFLVIAVVLPQMAGAETQEAARALIAGTDAAKAQITSAAEKSGKLAGVGKDIKLAARTDPKHGQLKWVVSENGEIRGWNEKNAIEVSLTPAMPAGKVGWSCRGYPITAMPQGCGGR